MLMMLERWTSRVVRGWLFVEALALELKGYNESEDDWRHHAADNHASCQVNVTSPQHALLATTEDVDEEKGGHERMVAETPFSSFRSQSKSWVPRSRMRRLFLNLFLLFSTAALIAYYALVHIRYIQEDGVWHTSWFYEWFLIPILLSFSFAAPLHRALGFHHHHDDCVTTAITRHDYEKCQQRLELLQKDQTTQWLIVAVATCYVTYIVGDVAFFIPISPYYQVISTWPIYLLAVTTNIGFIYQAFLLTILTMRAFCVRLQELERDIATVVATTKSASNNNNNNNNSVSSTTTTTTPGVDIILSDKVTHWVDCYEELRNHMHSVSRHFGFRMVLGLTMFVVETSNLILSVWSSVGSTLTATQTVCLLLTYMANAVVLMLTVFYAAHTATLCAQSIAPRLAVLSLRTNNDDNGNAQHSSLAVLAQAFVQMPIRLQTGNFNVTSEYANALTAWLFGLFLVVFGMKLPQV